MWEDPKSNMPVNSHLVPKNNNMMDQGVDWLIDSEYRVLAGYVIRRGYTRKFKALTSFI